MAKFSIVMDRSEPLSPRPVLIYKTSIKGFQDGEPGTFDKIFKFAEATVSPRIPNVAAKQVRIQSNFEETQYLASFDAIVDLETLQGKFQAVDNSEGDDAQADAKSAGAIPVSCKLTQVKEKEEPQKQVVFKCLSEKTGARIRAYVRYGEIHESTDGGLNWSIEDGLNVKTGVLESPLPPQLIWRFVDEEGNAVATVVRRMDGQFKMIYRKDSSIKCTKTEEAKAQ